MRPAIIGLGLTRFGRYVDETLPSVARGAVENALADAGVEPADLDMAFVANSMAGVITGQVSVVGQTLLHPLGFAGLPVFNVDNACASSSSALNLATHAVLSGAAELVLVLGAEKMVSPDKAKTFRALNGAADVEFVNGLDVDPEAQSVFVTSVYPPRLQAYAARHGLDPAVLAEISVKNRTHAALSPFAQFTDPLTIEQVLDSRMIVDPVTALMCSPISDGAAAVIVAAPHRVSPRHVPVWINGSAVGMAGSTHGRTAIENVSQRAYAQAGIGPVDVGVAEVHDSIAFNELLAYEELGFCEPGQGSRLVRDGSTSLGGRLPVNTGGGLESRGHPVAATGLAQVVELAWQIRGEAGPRQVDGVRHALAENAGGFAGGETAAVAVTILGSETHE